MAFPNDFHETLVAAANEATQFLSPPTAMINAVYAQHSSNYVGALGQTLKINIPKVNVANAVDEGRNGLTLIDPDDDSAQIVIDKKYGSNRKLLNMDLSLTPTDLANIYIAPVVEEVKQKLDIALAADVINNADLYPVIQGGADLFTRAQLGAAWGRLRAAGAPMNDPSKASFITHSVVMGSMLAATEFTSEAVVGIRAAEIAQQQAMILPQFGARIMDDANFESDSTAGEYWGVYLHKFAYGLRTVTPRLVSNSHVTQTPIQVAPNVFITLETWYEPMQQARVIHAYIICGHAMVRPELAQLLKTA